MVEGGDGKTTTVHFSNVVGCKVSRKHRNNFKVGYAFSLLYSHRRSIRSFYVVMQGWKGMSFHPPPPPFSNLQFPVSNIQLSISNFPLYEEPSLTKTWNGFWASTARGVQDDRGEEIRLRDKQPRVCQRNRRGAKKGHLSISGIMNATG